MISYKINREKNYSFNKIIRIRQLLVLYLDNKLGKKIETNLDI